MEASNLKEAMVEIPTGKPPRGGYRPRRHTHYTCSICRLVFASSQSLAGHAHCHYPQGKKRLREPHSNARSSNIMNQAQGVANPGGKKKNLLQGEGESPVAAAPRRKYHNIKQDARAAGMEGIGKHQCVCNTCGKGIDAAEVSSKPENQPKLQPPPGFPPLNPPAPAAPLVSPMVASSAAPPAALTVASTPVALSAARAEKAPMVASPAISAPTSPNASSNVAPPKAPIFIDLEAPDMASPPPSPRRTAPKDTPMVVLVSASDHVPSSVAPLEGPPANGSSHQDVFPWARGSVRATVSRRYLQGLRPWNSVLPRPRTFIRDNIPRLSGQPSSSRPILQPHLQAPESPNPNTSFNTSTHPTARVRKSIVVPSSVSQGYQIPQTAPALDPRIPGTGPSLLPHLNPNMRSFVGSENQATLSGMSTCCRINHQQPNLCASSTVPIAISSPVVSNPMPGSGANMFLRQPPPLSSSCPHARDPCGRLPAPHFLRDLMMDLARGNGNSAANGNSSNHRPGCVHPPMNVPAGRLAADHVTNFNEPLQAPPEPSRVFRAMASHNPHDPGIDENFVALGLPCHPLSCHNCGEML